MTAATFRCGHDRTPANTCGRACRTCKNAHARAMYRHQLTERQVGLLRRLRFHVAGLNEMANDPGTVRALAERGLIQRSRGRWALTAAGELAVEGS